jgi:hypothetical protein
MKPTREECARACDGARVVGEVQAETWMAKGLQGGASYLRSDAARIAELEAQVAGLRRALEIACDEVVYRDVNHQHYDTQEQLVARYLDRASDITGAPLATLTGEEGEE